MSLLSKFTDYSNEEGILFVISEFLKCETSESYDGILMILCELIHVTGNNEFLLDSIICKISIINSIIKTQHD